MKKRLLVTILVLVVLALTLAPASARAVVNGKVPKFWQETIPCTGDAVVLTGNMHLLITENGDATGGYHYTFHANPQGLSGVSQQGVVYHGVGITQYVVNIAADDLPAEATQIFVYNFIGNGAGNDFRLHETWHITFNSNGDLTVVFDNYWITCGTGG